MVKTKKSVILRAVAVVAAIVALLIIGAVTAYLTSVDEAVSTFTVGEIEVELTGADAAVPDDLTPNSAVSVDPTVTNLSESGNDAYVFLKVTVPKCEVITSNLATGEKSDSAVMQDLFQINNSSDASAVWKGENTNGTNNTLNSYWKVITSDTSGNDVNEYVLAYVTAPAAANTSCKVLAADESTRAFDSVTFANAVSGQNLEGSELDFTVESFAIQTDNITGHDEDQKDMPADVWAVLSGQVDDDE